MWDGIRSRDPVLVELSMDLLVPSLARVATYVVLGSAAAAVLVALHVSPLAALAPWIACWLFLAAYLARGLQLSGLGFRGVQALAWAPAYMAWKATLLATRPREGGGWVRTAREQPPGESKK
jgi:hypothetical protein